MYTPSKNGPGDLRSPIGKEPPACVQNAMMNREKKPFTYLPGGLDLSQIKSEKMARRLMINALSPGVQEKPKPPSFTPNPDTPPIKSMHYFNMPVAVFPCVQIPPNPKELLRRTSGPFNRSDSVESPAIKNIFEKPKPERVPKETNNTESISIKSYTAPKTIPEVKKMLPEKSIDISSLDNNIGDSRGVENIIPEVNVNISIKKPVVNNVQKSEMYDSKSDYNNDTEDADIIQPVSFKFEIRKPDVEALKPENTIETAKPDLYEFSVKKPVIYDEEEIKPDFETPKSEVFEFKIRKPIINSEPEESIVKDSEMEKPEEEKLDVYEFVVKKPVMEKPEINNIEERNGFDNIESEIVTFDLNKTETKPQEMEIIETRIFDMNNIETCKLEIMNIESKLMEINKLDSKLSAVDGDDDDDDDEVEESSNNVELSIHKPEDILPNIEDTNEANDICYTYNIPELNESDSISDINNGVDNFEDQIQNDSFDSSANLDNEDDDYLKLTDVQISQNPSPSVLDVIYNEPKNYSPIFHDIKDEELHIEIKIPTCESDEYIPAQECSEDSDFLPDEEQNWLHIDYTASGSMPECNADVKIDERIDEESFEDCVAIDKSDSNIEITQNCDITLENLSPLPRVEREPSPLKQCDFDELKIEDCKTDDEDRGISPMRRSTETIKSMTEDLDSLPSLNICSKRFSFLRDSPPLDEEKSVEQDDPYRIITGIPPKISLIDKKIEEPVKPKQEEDKPPSIIVNNYPEIKSPSPLANEFWKKDLWNITSPTKENVSIKDFLNDDPEPAWKKEIREIAMRKAEANEESEEYKVEKEPPWKRELRELTQAREAKLLNTTEITLNEPIYESPWGITNNTFYRPTNSAFAPNPNWSQTLRPKSWKERNPEPKPKEEDWKKTPSKHFMESFIKKQLSRSNSNSSDTVNKAPEITVEVVNQPSYTSTYASNSSNNGYVYPWESSSESSIAFSPEPRTPTPQSRNSPFTHNSSYSGYAQHNVVPREYGTLGFQPRRNPTRSCPIQSRSFKYLQQLTGTDDSYEDNEPFIPQPPQHAYPKPKNF